MLRNNDIGDVILATPLIHGLRKNYPNATIDIGVGDWAKDLLYNNPDINNIVSCNAPWHNKQICKYPANSIKTFLVGLSYILLSKEAKKLKQNQYSHGIDYLGSRQGSWLLKRLGIKKRYGIKGYAGGDNWCTKHIEFKINQHVSKTGINFLKLVNQDCTVEIDQRPQIYLTEEEKNSANSIWNSSGIHSDKIVIAPGAGFPEKSWGDEFFVELIKKILDRTNFSICVIGSSEDKEKINITHKRLLNLCGQLKLRESAALVSESDFLISNSSLAMHLAGAFHIPSITTLGPCYDSAQLHHKQWGYDENLMLGKEINQNRLHTYKPEEVFSEFSAYFHKNI